MYKLLFNLFIIKLYAQINILLVVFFSLIFFLFVTFLLVFYVSCKLCKSFHRKKESILDISKTRCRKQVKLCPTFFYIDILLMARKVFYSEINTHG